MLDFFSDFDKLPYLICFYYQQVALLKGGCIEMLVLRSTLTYDGQRNTWKVSYSFILISMLMITSGNCVMNSCSRIWL